MRVNYGQSVHGAEEIKAVIKVLKSSTQMGENTYAFEKSISRIFDKKYGLMVNSASSGLLLTFMSLNFPKGSNFITPVLTFSTTISSMVYSGYIPNFVDVKKNTFCIDEDAFEKKINKKTKGIVVPNLIGNIPDWIKIKKLAKKYNLIIIEDSADALGSSIDNKPTGYYTDISVVSFYGSHIINCAGNGGMVCLNNFNIYNKMKLMRSWGRSSSVFNFSESEKIENRFDTKLDGIKYDKKFIFSELGFNFEPSEIGAAFGRVQIKTLKTNIKKRTKNYNRHLAFFKKFKKFFELPLQYKNVNTGWLAFPLLIKSNKYFNRTDLQIFLEKNDIQTRVCFTGNILRQPGFKKIKCIKSNTYQNADYIMENAMLIGCHHGLKNDHINYMHKTISKFISSFDNI